MSCMSHGVGGGSGGSGGGRTGSPPPQSKYQKSLQRVFIFIAPLVFPRERDLPLRNAPFRPRPVVQFPVALPLFFFWYVYVPCMIRHGGGSTSSGSRRADFCMFSRCAARVSVERRRWTGGKTSGMRVTAGIRGTGGFGTGLDFQKKKKKRTL